MNGTKKIKYSRTDRIILGIAFVFLGVFVLSILIPLIYVVLASFMDPTVLNNQGLSFHIKDWTLDAYRRVLENDMIWRGFLNSFLYSIAFTVISVFVTLLAAYPMSKKEFVGRKLTEQRKSNIFSRSCFRYANRLSQYWHCGHLLECGTATLMR